MTHIPPQPNISLTLSSYPTPTPQIHTQVLNGPTFDQTASEVQTRILSWLGEASGLPAPRLLKAYTSSSSDMNTRFSFKYACLRAVYGTPTFMINQVQICDSFGRMGLCAFAHAWKHLKVEMEFGPFTNNLTRTTPMTNTKKNTAGGGARPQRGLDGGGLVQAHRPAACRGGGARGGAGAARGGGGGAG